MANPSVSYTVPRSSHGSHGIWSVTRLKGDKLVLPLRDARRAMNTVTAGAPDRIFGTVNFMAKGPFRTVLVVPSVSRATVPAVAVAIPVGVTAGTMA